MTDLIRETIVHNLIRETIIGSQRLDSDYGSDAALLSDKSFT